MPLSFLSKIHYLAVETPKTHSPMKKFSCLLLLLLLVNTSGCRTEHFLITGITFKALEAETYRSGKNSYLRYNCISEFNERIMFGISYETKFLYEAYNLSSGIGAQCYALTLGEAFDNSLLEETFSITLDKPFTYDGNTIESGSNILDDPAIKADIAISGNTDTTACGGTICNLITFSDAFTGKTSFEEGDYAVRFSCSTSDQKFFCAETIVKFSL